MKVMQVGACTFDLIFSETHVLKEWLDRVEVVVYCCA